MCAEPDPYEPLAAPVAPEPAAMVPVLQLYARDVPGLVLPAGTDLLQILWCPLVHEDDQCAANPQLRWRSTALTAGATAGQPPRPHAADEDYLPRPCTVSPTPATEYPNWDLPQGLGTLLGERFETLKEERGYDYFEVATTQQSKVGGYPGWTQEPDRPDCAGCGSRMEHLLSITATEPGMGRWLPLDDRDPGQDGATTPCWMARADPAALDTFGHDMDLGDLGGMCFFICRSCPDTPYTHRYERSEQADQDGTMIENRGTTGSHAVTRDDIPLIPDVQWLEERLGEGTLWRPSEADLPAELTDAGSREFLITVGFPTVHLDVVDLDTRHLRHPSWKEPLDADEIYGERYPDDDSPPENFAFTVATRYDQHLMLDAADGGITHYDPNGWDHGRGWKGIAANDLPTLAALLGLIGESSATLSSTDDALRTAALTEMRERMIEMEPYVDDCPFWAEVFQQLA
ncbi:hypothetical protein GCM10018780_25700 [Streptomyces lanatus]|nr:hypothetical protein GCM10018780_25700 [Streptomyces lanatus]